MPSSRRRRLALDGVGVAGAVAWQKLKAKVTRRPAPLATSVVMHRFDSFVTWHDRPKTVDLRHPVSGVPPQPLTAIVVQGGVLAESDFTAETVRTYRAYYPGALIYVSTWVGLDPATRASLEAAGAIVLLNEMPANVGNGNVNLQITSTRAGVEAARDAGAEYVLKTRSDQRLYAPKALPFMIGLIEAFPVVDPAGTQRGRIVTASLGTFKVIPYHLSDMFTFGRVDDMLAYWSAPLDDKALDWEPPERERTPRAFTERNHCEIWLFRHFLERMGEAHDVSLHDWWRILGERTVIVDAASVDLLWPKYTLREYRHRDYAMTSFFEEVQMSDWLLMARDPSLHGMDVPEHCLDEVYPWPLGG